MFSFTNKKKQRIVDYQFKQIDPERFTLRVEAELSKDDVNVFKRMWGALAYKYLDVTSQKARSTTINGDRISVLRPHTDRMLTQLLKKISADRQRLQGWAGEYTYYAYDVTLTFYKDEETKAYTAVFNYKGDLEGVEL